MSGDRALLETLLAWRAAGHGVTLLTVARTWGAAPRPAGSLMALRDDGATIGSISGGCVEEDLLARLRAGEVALERPARVTYGATRNEAERLGLPCGGRMEIVIERLDHDHGLPQLHAALAGGQSRVRRLHLDSGAVELLARGAEFHCDDRIMERRFGPGWRLLLIGANDLARHLLHGAAHLDYEVIICDPRAETRAAWNLCDMAHQGVVDPRMPDEAAAAYADERTAVITLSHDPRVDDLALMQALTGPAFYVGAIGSRSNSERRRARLATLDLPAGWESRLRAPVGMAIGSRTPPEIAIAILAEVTAVRRGLESRVAAPAMCFT